MKNDDPGTQAPPNKSPVYIGDGVTLSFDGWMLKLSTPRDGREDVIYLESNVFHTLKEYGNRYFKIPGEQND